MKVARPRTRPRSSRTTFRAWLRRAARRFRRQGIYRHELGILGEGLLRRRNTDLLKPREPSRRRRYAGIPPRQAPARPVLACAVDDGVIWWGNLTYPCSDEVTNRRMGFRGTVTADFAQLAQLAHRAPKCT
jgi:hypothetical protein